jgi:hypothetical protein
MMTVLSEISLLQLNVNPYHSKRRLTTKFGKLIKGSRVIVNHGWLLETFLADYREHVMS